MSSRSGCMLLLLGPGLTRWTSFNEAFPETSARTFIPISSLWSQNLRNFLFRLFKFELYSLTALIAVLLGQGEVIIYVILLSIGQISLTGQFSVALTFSPVALLNSEATGAWHHTSYMFSSLHVKQLVSSTNSDALPPLASCSDAQRTLWHRCGGL